MRTPRSASWKAPATPPPACCTQVLPRSRSRPASPRRCASSPGGCGPVRARTSWTPAARSGPALLREFRPPLVGWRSTEHPYSLDARWLPLAGTARRMEYSTMSYAAAIALGRAIRYVTSLALDEIADHNRQLTAQLIDGLTQRGANLLTPRDPKRRAGTVTARFPAATARPSPPSSHAAG